MRTIKLICLVSFVVFLGIAGSNVFATPYASSPSPTDGETDVAIETNLTWTRGDGAVADELYFGTESPLPLVNVIPNTSPALFDPGDANLIPSTTYYWQIVEVNGLDRYEGDIWEFSTISGKTSVLYPDDGEVIPIYVSGENIFTWMDFAGGPTTETYECFFSDNREDVVNRESSVSLGAPPFLPTLRYYVGFPGIPPYEQSLVLGTTYYWCVDGSDAFGRTFDGDIWQFSIQGYRAFYASSPSPADGETDVAIETNLTWTRGEGAVADELYFGTESPPPLVTVIPNTSPALFDPGDANLIPSTTYYWQIVEVIGLDRYEGPIWSFTTVSGKCTVLYPADGSVIPGQEWDENIYTWMDFAGGPTTVSYECFFSDNREDVVNRESSVSLGAPPFSNTLRYYVGFPGIPPYEQSLVRETTYYWCVDGSDALGNTFGGDIWQFSIQGYKAFDPDPPDEAVDVETTVLLSWLPGVQAYCRSVFIGTSWDDVNNAVYDDYLNPPPEFLATVLEPNILVTDLAYGVKYYWRVDEIYGRCCGMPYCIGPYYKGDVWSFSTRVAIPGLAGEYYHWFDDIARGGGDPGPIDPFQSKVLVRLDPDINFDFDAYPPPGVDADNFSIRWTGRIAVPYPGETYTFTTETGDGARLWVDDTLVIDQWIDQGTTAHSGSIYLDNFGPYDIRMEYYENGGGAVARLMWESASLPYGVIPSNYLASTSEEAKAAWTAYRPYPRDRGLILPNENLEFRPTLSWVPGLYSSTHELYFSSDFDDVNDRTAPRIVVSDSSYTPPGTLDMDQTYYWCIDESNGLGPAPGDWPGDVWSFTTVSGKASVLYPADGSVIPGQVSGENIYTWMDFAGGPTTETYECFFSDSREDVVNRDPSVSLGAPPFLPTLRYYVGFPGIPPYEQSLVRETTYYWCVDGSDAFGHTFGGDIWEFSIQGYRAFDPDPPDGAVHVDTDVLLSWKPGIRVTEHDVYIGTDINSVPWEFDWDFPPPEYIGTVTEPYILVTGLAFNTKYYWRVDEVYNRMGPTFPGEIYKGAVWSFTTLPRRIFVDMDAGGANNGASWENAYNFLQDALAEAAGGDEIWVAEGVYRPDRSAADPNGSGSRGASFLLINGVAIKGGYAGFGESEPNVRDIEAYETILSGDLAGNDADVNEARELLDDPCRAENSYHVVISYQNDANAVLDGFTITSGNANGTYYNDGGGIYCELSSPMIVNCTFSRNTGSSGGGMFNYKSPYSSGEQPPPEYLGNPVLTNCTFIMNAAEYSGGGFFNCCFIEPTVTNCAFIDNWAGSFGGGICNVHGDFEISNCTFIGNSSSHQFGGGGGMSNWSSNPIVTCCTFIGNTTYEYGGGMSNWSSNPIVTGCTFRKNWAVYGGGGMANEDDSSPIVTNCLFVENEAFDGGGGMFSWESSPRLINCTFSCNWTHGPIGGAIFDWGYSGYTLTNCIVWGDWFGEEIVSGTAVVTYSNIQGGWPGEGNIDTNPCFVEPGLWEDPCNTPGYYLDDIRIEGDYHLRSQSGRWDANSESWVQDNITSPCIDAGNPGCPVGDEPAPNGSRRNMGAYGGTAEASKSPANWRSIADFTNDWIVDSNDLKIFVNYWLEMGQCIASDLDRDESADFNDFALFGQRWSDICISGRNITYVIGECIPVESGSSGTEESDQTRFTVTGEGPYILFEDMMRANYCTPDLELQMAIEGDLIMIHELAYTILDCEDICDHAVTARLGPFETGIYTLEVYETMGGFIGSTTITIGPDD